MRHLCLVKTPPRQFDPEAEAPSVAFGLDVAVMRGLTWPNGTVLRVSFLENTDEATRSSILYHMNAWNRRGVNVRFVYSNDQPHIRITRDRREGYWSFLGIDSLYIPTTEPTMALGGMSSRTPETEQIRVIRHETGHVLGCPHEHSRAEVVAKLDRAKVIAFFKKYQGWDEQTIIDNILTPLPPRDILGTRMPEPTSIMSYAFPASLTRNGVAIPGGTNITALDSKFMASIYPVTR